MSRDIEVTLKLDSALLEFVAKEVQRRKHKYLNALADPHRAEWKREKAKRSLARLDEFTDTVERAAKRAERRRVPQ